MMNESLSGIHIAALDLGTTKFCLATFDTCGKKLSPPLKTLSIDADGMRRGMLADFDKARQALVTLLSMAEKEHMGPINRIAVGIAGSHLKSDYITYDKVLTDQRITKQTLDKMSEEAARSGNKHDLVSLHTIPVAYQPNNREWIENPLGFHTDKLSGKYFRISADRHYVSDVISLCNQAGLEVTSLYAEPWASTAVTLTSEDKEKGVVLADIGGGTTDGIVFHSSQPIKLFTINIGGVLMTRDLSLGLNVPYQYAEQIKFERGLSDYTHSETKAGEMTSQKILYSRAQELAWYLNKELNSLKLPYGAGLILTGGGSEVKGLCEEFSKLLKMQVRAVIPAPEEKISGDYRLQEHYFIPLKAAKYATVSGMLILELQKLIETKCSRKKLVLEKYLRQFYNWIRELS